MRAPPVLHARDELKEDAVDSVPEARLVPLYFPGMFLAFVQQESF